MLGRCPQLVAASGLGLGVHLLVGVSAQQQHRVLALMGMGHCGCPRDTAARWWLPFSRGLGEGSIQGGLVAVVHGTVMALGCSQSWEVALHVPPSLPLPTPCSPFLLQSSGIAAGFAVPSGPSLDRSEYLQFYRAAPCPWVQKGGAPWGRHAARLPATPSIPQRPHQRG